MKYLLILALFLASCSSGGDYVGNWHGRDKDVVITKASSGYVFTDFSGSYPADYKDGKLIVNFTRVKVDAVLNDERTHLIFGGETYVKR